MQYMHKADNTELYFDIKTATREYYDRPTRNERKREKKYIYKVKNNIVKTQCQH